MGQRFQLFLKVNNPVKNKRNYSSDEDKKLMRKMFGSGKHTIIALHHQWLYGRSAVYVVNHILNVTNPNTMNEYNNPFGESYMIDSLEKYIDDVMMLLQVQSNPKFPRGIGIERMTFLNSECIDDNGKYDSRWDMRLYFNIGDNNDGISIIDTIERKYCLMNISSQELGDTSVNNLPSMIPCSAEDYVNSYYPNNEQLRDNIITCLPLKNFPILDKKEISKMFPKMNYGKQLA